MTFTVSAVCSWKPGCQKEVRLRHSAAVPPSTATPIIVMNSRRRITASEIRSRHFQPDLTGKHFRLLAKSALIPDRTEVFVDPKHNEHELRCDARHHDAHAG